MNKPSINITGLLEDLKKYEASNPHARAQVITFIETFIAEVGGIDAFNARMKMLEAEKYHAMALAFIAMLEVAMIGVLNGQARPEITGKSVGQLILHDITEEKMTQLIQQNETIYKDLRSQGFSHKEILQQGIEAAKEASPVALSEKDLLSILDIHPASLLDEEDFT